MAFYESVIAGNVGTGVFDYTNEDGESFANSASVPAEINFPDDLTIVNINNSLSLEWEGTALGSDELCLVTVTGENTTVAEDLFLTTSEGLIM